MKKDSITFLGNCPMCSVAYTEKLASIVEKSDEAMTLHVDCVKCKSSVLLTVYSGLKGLVTTIGVPTDLEKKDILRIKRSKSLTGDDVLDLHTFLEKNNDDRKSKKTTTKS